MSIKSFGEIQWSSVSQSMTENIENEIKSFDKDYVLNVSQEELIKFLYDKYYLEPLKIDSASESFGTPNKIMRTVRGSFGHNINQEVYIFTFKYKYEGNPQLFEITPSSYALTFYTIDVDKKSEIVSFSFTIDNHNPDAFHNLKSQCYHKAFANLEEVNREAEKWNKALEGTINSIFTRIKGKYIDENKFFEAINLKINPESKMIYSVPTIKKKIIPQPKISPKKNYSSEPTISYDIYQDILKVIYQSGKKMETKPSLYVGKDEEGLRDQFLFILEDRYEGATATGETFNIS